MGNMDEEPTDAPVEEEDEHQKRRKYALWLPNLVPDKEQRNIANCVWVTSLLSFLAFACYTIAKPYHQRNDPPANERTVSGLYQIPDVAICFNEDGYGCRAHGLPDYPQYRNTSGGAFCASSARGIAFGFENMEPNITVEARDIFPYQVGLVPECLLFPTSTLRALDNGFPIGFRVEMMWHTRDAMDESIDQQKLGRVDPPGSMHSHHEAEMANMVPVYLIRPGVKTLDDLDHDEKTYYTPFNMVNFSAPESYRNQHWRDSFGNEVVRGQYSSTVLTLHMYEHLTRTHEYDYAATATTGQIQVNLTALFENVHALPEQADYTNDFFGWTVIEFSILSLKTAVTKEIDPVNWTVIMGVIGGAWGYVLLAFNIFYRPATPDDDFVLRRNFRKGVETVKKVPIPIPPSVRASLQKTVLQRNSGRSGNSDETEPGRRRSSDAMRWEEEQPEGQEKKTEEVEQDATADNRYTAKEATVRVAKKKPASLSPSYRGGHTIRSFSAVVHDASIPTPPPEKRREEEEEEARAVQLSPLHQRGERENANLVAAAVI